MTHRQFRIPSVWLLAIALGTAAGCSSRDPDQPEVVPIRGEVWYRGQPVPVARVAFQCAGAPRAAIGETDDEGRFQLGTFGIADGAPLGEHIVTISVTTSEAPVQNVTEAGYAQAQQARKTAGAPGSLLPARYADMKTSGLRATVSRDGPREFRFELTD